MTRIRKKNPNRPGAAAKGGEQSAAKKGADGETFGKGGDKPSGGPGPFTEQDIEFMKKAI